MIVLYFIESFVAMRIDSRNDKKVGLFLMEKIICKNQMIQMITPEIDLFLRNGKS